MKRHLLSVAAYVLATFAVQAINHFVINAEHYAALGYERKEPIFALGLLSMLIQGAVFSYLFGWLSRAEGPPLRAVTFAWLAGSVLVSYEALAEAAKYQVPNVGTWVLVEALAGFAQFTLFGLLLGWIHRRASAPVALSEAPA